MKDFHLAKMKLLSILLTDSYSYKKIHSAGARSAQQTAEKKRIIRNAVTWIETGDLSSLLKAHTLK